MLHHFEGPPTQDYKDPYKHKPQPLYPLFKKLGYEKEIARTWSFLTETFFVTLVIIVVIVTMAVVYSVAPFNIGKDIISTIFGAFTVLTIGIGFAFNSSQVHKGNKWSVHDTIQKSLADMQNNLECQQAFRMLTAVSTTHVKLTPTSKTKLGYFGIYKVLQPLDDNWQLDDNGRTNFKIDIHEVALALVNHKPFQPDLTHDFYDPALIWYHISGGQCVYLNYQKDIRRQICTLLMHLAHISHLMEIAGYRVHDVPVLREWVAALVPIGGTSRTRTIRVMLYRILWTYIATRHAKMWHDLRRLAVQYHVLCDVEIETYFQAPLDAPRLRCSFDHWVQTVPSTTNHYTLESLFSKLQLNTRKQKQYMKDPQFTLLTKRNTRNVEAKMLIHAFVMKFMELDKHFFEVYEYSGDHDYVSLQDMANGLWRLDELTQKRFHIPENCQNHYPNALQLRSLVSKYQRVSHRTKLVKKIATWLGFKAQVTDQLENGRVVGIIKRYRVTIQLSFKGANIPSGFVKVCACGNVVEFGNEIPEQAQEMTRKEKNVWEVKVSPEVEDFRCFFICTCKQNGQETDTHTENDISFTPEELRRGHAKWEIDCGVAAALVSRV